MEGRWIMVKRIFILLFLAPALCFGQANKWSGFGQRNGHSNGYLYARTITIDHTKIPNTDQSNFPVLVSGTFSYLATVANSGSVNNTTTFNGQTVPADVIFTSDLAGTTLLSWDYASYSASTGQSEIWIKFSTLHTGSDDVIYMWYGKSSVTTYQGGSVGSAYDANYKIVQHLPDGTSLTANDATSNANNGTLVGSPTAVAGKIDGAAAFNGSSQYITAPQISLTTGITIEAWVYRINSGGEIAAVSFGTNGTDGFGFWLSNIGDNLIHFIKYSVADISSGIATTANTWEHIVWTVDSDLKPRLYKNGSLVYTSTNTQSIVSTTHVSVFGAVKDGSGTPSNYLQGNIDEIRLSNVVRSADWITTEYNNQNSPSTFYTIGSQY
jgi:hypothetical protein